ncbi:hypothetical protein [Streptomyces sp. UNOC14_S4]|uniref:hypothetical protein n=1 Tax=Streptomyces sp. UNOC14_S4 TaxID=2872340 RepID=UPI001E2D8BA4|nr:hypothetical protein [Streptomyces sp. UNOC14_S4]MCC3766667.1 hypothetical protein [Streptomyces sp. UNOC14_S4]
MPTETARPTAEAPAPPELGRRRVNLVFVTIVLGMLRPLRAEGRLPAERGRGPGAGLHPYGAGGLRLEDWDVTDPEDRARLDRALDAMAARLLEEDEQRNERTAV